MNKQQLIDLLKDDIIFNNIKSDNFDDVEWKAQNSKRKTILFYNLADNMNAIDAFKSRLENAEYGVLITDNESSITKSTSNTIIIKKESWLKAQKLICDIFYLNLEKMNLVGVTGTNGKTTTVELSRQIAYLNKKRALSLGTLGLRNQGQVIFDYGLTTPPYIELRKIIYSYQDDYDVLFMELSSHALEQQRPYKLKLDVAGWTSFSQDHLDYHKDEKSYFNAKEKIFNLLKEGAYCYVPHKEEDIIRKVSKKHLRVTKELKLTHIPPFFETQFNKNNLELAYEMNKQLWGECFFDIDRLQPPEGRFMVIEWQKRKIIIDFAHTPDALRNIGIGIKSAYPGSRVLTVFGCGGDRDKSKRPVMGKAVEEFSDIIIVTSDNPRTEDPEQIINDIRKGLTHNSIPIVSREKAILEALTLSKEDDVVLIAGKGHENYIIIGTEKKPFSNEQVVRNYIKEHS